MRLQIPTPADFSFPETLAAHGWPRLAPFVWDGAAQTLSRPERLEDGTVVTLTLSATDGAVAVETEGVLDGEEVTRRVRRMLQLDLPLAGFHAYCRACPDLAPIAESNRGRMLRCPTLFGDTLKVIATTNTTWAQTIAMSARLVRHFGAEGRAFPTPSEIAAVPPEEFAAQARMGYRSGFVHGLARSIAEGRLDLEAWQDEGLSAADLRKRLLSLPGIGPYGAACLLLHLGRPAHVNADSVARALLGKELGRPVTDKEVLAFFDGHGEWRGLVYNFYPWRQDSPEMGTMETMTPDTPNAPLLGAQAASSQGDAAPDETDTAEGQTPDYTPAQQEEYAEEASVGEGPEATPSPS